MKKRILSIIVIIMIALLISSNYVNAEYENVENTESEVTINSNVPIELKIENNYDGVKLTWNKLDENTEYEIYRGYNETGEYSKIGNTSTNSYIDKDVYSGTRYYYKVKKTGETYFSEPIYTFFVAAPKGTIQSYDNKAKIKWGEDKYITGYEIYRATSKTENYEKIKTINKATTSYTDKNIKAKKSYFYKLKSYFTAYDKTYYSADSKIIEKTKYAQVVIKSSSVNNTKKSITLKWKKVSGTNGYQIYRATSKNGKYKKIKTIKKKSTTSYTDKKDIGIGKLYYYKIRAYKNNGDKKEYGQFSSEHKQTTGSRKQQMNKLKLKPGTTGFKELDGEYKKIIKKVTKGKNSNYDKVKAVYKYVVDHMSHNDYHCKQFNGTFAGMIKVLGIENVYCARGYTSTTSGGWAEHTWTIIEINDTRYVFDTSLDRHVKDRTKKVTFSKFFKTEKEVKKSYKLSYYHSDAWPVKLSTKEFGYIYY